VGWREVVPVRGMMDYKTLNKLRLRVVAAAALADDAADVVDQAEQEHELVLLRYRRALNEMAKIRKKKLKEAKIGPTVATDHDRRAGKTTSQQRAADDAG
jgi:hypothetical protein